MNFKELEKLKTLVRIIGRKAGEGGYKSAIGRVGIIVQVDRLDVCIEFKDTRENRFMWVFKEDVELFQDDNAGHEHVLKGIFDSLE
jgi:hypothetical protein